LRARSDYQVAEDGPWLTRLQAELQAGSGTIGLLGACTAHFSHRRRQPLSICRASMSRGQGQRGYKNSACSEPAAEIQPWMQATYLMAGQQAGACNICGGHRSQHHHL